LIRPDVVRLFANTLLSGMMEGYGSNAEDIADFTTPDGSFIFQLQKNVWQFSAAKNYQQLKELSLALVDETGRLRSYADFKKAAFVINDRHVHHWLQAEYNQAVAGGQMAAKWQELQTEGGMLEYDAVADMQTTRLCSGLNGVIKPLEHPFWNTYYPPNHWGCRSTVRSVQGRYESGEHTFTTPDIPPMFQTNLAKDKLIFPKNHPYYHGCPDEVLNEGEKLFLHGK